VIPATKQTTDKTPPENLTTYEKEVVQTAEEQNALSIAPQKDEQNTLSTE